ncbi:MAG: hypothetical protein ACJ79S_03000 [Gemmatimonadaceae bacterium]
MADAPAPRGVARWLAPRVVLPAIAGLLLLVVLLTPVDGERSGDPRLTTRSAAPQGARGLFELAARLGWRPKRRDVPFLARDPRVGGVPLDSSAVYAVLAPPTDLTAGEAGALLAEVRRGAGLLVVLQRGSTLAESLGVRPSRGGAAQVVDPATDSLDGCPRRERFGFINWPGERVYSYWLEPRRPVPASAVSFAWVEGERPRTPRRAARPSAPAAVADSAVADSAVADSDALDDGPDVDDASAGREDDGPAADTGAAPPPPPPPPPTRRSAALGFPLGAGRVVAVADPDWLRNDVLRVCKWNAAVQAVRMLEYLSGGAPPAAGGGGARTRLVFDEYHQGFGRQPSTLRAIGRALTADPRGRALLEALVAALVLLAALGARPLSPRPTARLERRSPLEHVGALSRAYAQIGATRLATRRLVRGIRRRHGAWGTFGGGARAAGGGGESDDAFLAAIAERFPAAAADVALLREASRTPRAPAAFLEVGRAAERVEQALAGRAGAGGSPGAARRPHSAAPAQP